MDLFGFFATIFVVKMNALKLKTRPDVIRMFTNFRCKNKAREIAITFSLGVKHAIVSDKFR